MADSMDYLNPDLGPVGRLLAALRFIANKRVVDQHGASTAGAMRYAAERVLDRAAGAEEVERDAARWRFVQAFLEVDSDIDDPESGSGKMWSWLTAERLSELKAVEGMFGNVGEVVDAMRARMSVGTVVG